MELTIHIANFFFAMGMGSVNFLLKILKVVLELETKVVDPVGVDPVLDPHPNL